MHHGIVLHNAHVWPHLPGKWKLPGAVFGLLTCCHSWNRDGCADGIQSNLSTFDFHFFIGAGVHEYIKFCLWDTPRYLYICWLNDRPASLEVCPHHTCGRKKSTWCTLDIVWILVQFQWWKGQRCYSNGRKVKWHLLPLLLPAYPMSHANPVVDPSPLPIL